MNKFCKTFFGMLFAVIALLMLLLSYGLVNHLRAYSPVEMVQLCSRPSYETVMVTTP